MYVSLWLRGNGFTLWALICPNKYKFILNIESLKYMMGQFAA